MSAIIEFSLYTAVLRGLVRGAKIFADTNDAPKEQKKHLNDFLASLAIATKIHSQHGTLKSLGHPNYQVSFNFYY